MKVILLFFTWCLLLVICWPLAVLACVAAPFVWLLAIPFRVAGAAVHALITLVHTLLLLPARILGYRGRA